MTVSENFYCGRNIKYPDRLIEKLHRKRMLKKFFLVGFPENGDRLEIVSSLMFHQKRFKTSDYEIAALFLSESEAFEYVRCLADLSFKKFSRFNHREAVGAIASNEIDYIFSGEDEE